MLSHFRHWNYTKKVYQLTVINFRKSLPHHRYLESEFYTLFVFHLSFFVFGILIHFFFLLFCKTSNYINPEFQNFYPTIVIRINENSQHNFRKNRGNLIWNEKTELRNFKRHNRIDVSRTCIDLKYK